MKKPDINLDEARIRYITACDELIYLARQIAAYTTTTTTYEEAGDLLNGLCERVESVLEDVELIKDDSLAE